MITDPEQAVRHFCNARHEDETIKVRSISTNGGVGGSNGCVEWCSGKKFDQIVSGTYFHLHPDTIRLRYDPDRRELLAWDKTPEGIYQTYQLFYDIAPDAGYRKIAYMGDAGNFVWLYWLQEIPPLDEGEQNPPKALEDVLCWARWDKGKLQDIGVTCYEDYSHGSLGGYWLVRDQARFEAAMERGYLSDKRFPFAGIRSKFVYLAFGIEPMGGYDDWGGNADA